MNICLTYNIISAVEYNDCISAEGVRCPSPQMSVLGRVLNYIWWLGSSSGALENMEYSFIAITPRSTLTQSGRTCLGLIFESNRTV